QPPGKLASTIGDHDHPGFSHTLEASGEIRRIAYDRRLQRGTRADHVSDHDYASRNAYAGTKRACGARDSIQAADALDEGQARAHRPFGIVFVRAGVAKIDQYPIAKIAGHEAAEPGGQTPHTGVKCGDDLTQVFRIEPRPKRRRPDQVGKHDRKVPTLDRRHYRRSRSRLTEASGLGHLSSTAVGTKRLVRRVLAAAGARAPRQRRSAIAAELSSVRDVHAAAWADHATFLFRTVGDLRCILSEHRSASGWSDRCRVTKRPLSMAARGPTQAGGTQTYAQDTKIFALRRVIVRLGSVL